MELIISVILFLLSVGSFIIGYAQFKEKGVLLNNAYLYASKEERITMNKKPYYRQSAIVFTIIGLIFFVLAMESIIHSGWLAWVIVGLAFVVIVYAIASSVTIERKNRI